MANHPAEGNIVMLNIRIATPPWDRSKNTWMDVNPGISSYVYSLKAGDKVTVSGDLMVNFIKETENEMVYIGGGAGMANAFSFIYLFHTMKTDSTFYYGGRSKELFYLDDFRKIEEEFPNFKFHVALSEPLPEDNWKEKKNIDDDGDGFVGLFTK